MKDIIGYLGAASSHVKEALKAVRLRKMISIRIKAGEVVLNIFE